MSERDLGLDWFEAARYGDAVASAFLTWCAERRTALAAYQDAVLSSGHWPFISARRRAEAKATYEKELIQVEARHQRTKAELWAREEERREARRREMAP